MRHRFLSAMIFLFAPALAFGGEPDARAEALARDLLDRGAALFDKRDAAAMAATYIETAEIVVLKRDSQSDRIVVESRRGREEIEKSYADIFKDRLPEHRSRNTVEEARFLAPDLLLIRGRFAMNREQGDIVRFVQIRARDGDRWKIATLQLMELPKPNP
jgi:ketosteroid isomerase-like protein